MTTKEKNKKRRAWDLINQGISYSEMTDEEIEEVIEIKANIIANNIVNKEIVKLSKEEAKKQTKELLKIHNEMSDAFQKTIKNLVEQTEKEKIDFESQLCKVENG